MKNYKLVFCFLMILTMVHLPNSNASYGQDYGPAMNEGQLREKYYGADRNLMKCANGSSDCSSKRVEDLKAARSAAQNGLSIHYNYKYVGGEFIKKPRD